MRAIQTVANSLKNQENEEEEEAMDIKCGSPSDTPSLENMDTVEPQGRPKVVSNIGQ